MCGVGAFAQELRDLGFEVTELGDFVTFSYEVDAGPLVGQTLRVGLNAAGYPHSPPSGPFVCPRLLPLQPDGSPAPYGGVHTAERDGFVDPDGRWQYWSRPFNDWLQQGRSAKAYVRVHLRRLFANLPTDREYPCAA